MRNAVPERPSAAVRLVLALGWIARTAHPRDPIAAAFGELARELNGRKAAAEPPAITDAVRPQPRTRSAVRSAA